MTRCLKYFENLSNYKIKGWEIFINNWVTWFTAIMNLSLGIAVETWPYLAHLILGSWKFYTTSWLLYVFLITVTPFSLEGIINRKFSLHIGNLHIPFFLTYYQNCAFKTKKLSQTIHLKSMQALPYCTKYFPFNLQRSGLVFCDLIY